MARSLRSILVREHATEAAATSTDERRPVPERTLLDVVVLTDLRFPGGTSTSLADEICAASAAGYRIGALQLDSVHLRRGRLFHPAITELIADGRLTLLVPGEPVDTSLAIVKHPYVLAQSLGGRLPITAQQAIVVCGQVPVEGNGRVLYDPALVQAHTLEALGLEPRWHPISPLVRRALSSSGVPLADHDWLEILDPKRWAAPDRTELGTRAPVIGRHGRDDPLKWPNDPDQLQAAYPVTGTPSVRILGGADSVTATLGEIPPAWEVHPYGSMDAADFLSGIDAFVYQHHPDLTEAFGRTILEALASGAVAIVPEALAEPFEDVCLTATANEVPAVLAQAWADPAAWQNRVDRGRELVKRRFSDSSHVSRLHALIGSPRVEHDDGRAAAQWKAVPTQVLAQRPVVLVSLLGAEPAEVDRALEILSAQRAQETGFHPVLVVTGPKPARAIDLGIECKVVTSRRAWEGPEPWPEYAARRLRQLFNAYGGQSITVWDPAHPDAWISLGVSTRPSGE